jgi:hypothetical protein
MIAAISDINIKIGSDVYRLKDLYNKTLYSTRELPIFKTYLSKIPIGKTNSNEAIGIVQGFVANGYKGAKGSFFLIGPDTKNTKAIPYAANYFSSTSLQQQGIKNAEEVVQSDENQNQPWYIKLTKTALPYLVGAGIIIYFINKKSK